MIKKRNMSTGKMFKNFGITGKEIEIMFRDMPDPLFNHFFMPAKVLEEYNKYLVVEIQPHYNPYNYQGISKPYRWGVNKTCLWSGDTIIKYKGKKVIQ